MKYGVFFLVFCFSFFSQARDLTLVYKNNIAVVKYHMQKHQESLDQFIGLTAIDPNDLVIRLNMASTLNSLGEHEKSAQLNTTLLKDIEAQLLATKDNEQVQELVNLKFAALFNRGVAHQVMKNTDLALASYQEALALRPDSKEIKTNIEMMFAKGGGKGKGEGKDKQKGEGEGEGDSEGEGDQDEKDKKNQPKDQQGNDQQKKQNKEFDQKYMSNEDLKRIMEELKDQEQKIRAKMERSGDKNAKGKKGDGKNEKEW